jgi:hypothetical protein
MRREMFQMSKYPPGKAGGFRILAAQSGLMGR